MSDVASQKRIAASILKCGVNRVWFDPERLSDIQNAISREDLRGLITDGAIKAHQKKGVSRGRARVRTAQRAYGHRKGAGKRKGAQGARTPSKRSWIQKIRAIRKVLVTLRDEGTIDRHLYRVLYRKAAGGQFRSVAHMKAQMEIIAGRLK
ncbi:Ribosomal protein L19e [Methanoregula boonei 6A8]|jgi:large subunit ribosomal protein L19e|uniref:Large ribosomal subunit protein eL19 n=1 Tax=Methanoregula boonei (strain DSM 21154 / JCM 14090 / 6A8) TaxID=456442 RepID=A7I5Q7_METB6|nr:50S ribosomal protein L19e [Methanoregula boonei]ABS55068.1 Ribosomal protein L19e [Methanoregula boonei 6A8]